VNAGLGKDGLGAFHAQLGQQAPLHTERLWGAPLGAWFGAGGKGVGLGLDPFLQNDNKRRCLVCRGLQQP
jgi:hypothetical protein